MKRKGPASSSSARASKKRNEAPLHRSAAVDDLVAPSIPENNYLPWCLQIEASLQLKRFTTFSYDRLLQVARKIATDEAMSNKLAILYIRISIPELLQIDNDGQLQIVQSSKNRMALLKQMYLSKWKSNSWEEDDIVQDLVKKLCKTSTSKRSRRIIVNDQSKSDKTLRSRVETLGKQQMQDMEALIEKDKVIQRCLAAEELVVCADAVRLFMRGAMRRKGTQQRSSLLLSSTATSLASKPIKMTMGLNEVLNIVQKTKSDLGNHDCTKKHARETLESIVKIVPEWIHIVKSKKNEVSIHNRSTVVIQEHDGLYQNVRVKLGGRNVQANTSSHNENPKVTANQQPTQVETVPTTLPNIDSTKPKGTSAKAQRMSWMEEVPKATDQHIRPPMYKSKLSLSKNRLAAANALQTSKPQSEIQVATHDEGVSLPQSQDKSPQLRVNFTQVLTAADYDGGEVIDSTSTNPRDLKRMFAQLNNGERI
jgi:hypothetical protein